MEKRGSRGERDVLYKRGTDRRGRDAFVPDSEAAAREAKPRQTSSQEHEIHCMQRYSCTTLPTTNDVLGGTPGSLWEIDLLLGSEPS
jgi:hypothetical protein